MGVLISDMDWPDPRLGTAGAFNKGMNDRPLDPGPIFQDHYLGMDLDIGPVAHFDFAVRGIKTNDFLPAVDASMVVSVDFVTLPGNLHSDWFIA